MLHFPNAIERDSALYRYSKLERLTRSKTLPDDANGREDYLVVNMN
jgi:hypothetical protein